MTPVELARSGAVRQRVPDRDTLADRPEVEELSKKFVNVRIDADNLFQLFMQFFAIGAFRVGKHHNLVFGRRFAKQKSIIKRNRSDINFIHPSATLFGQVFLIIQAYHITGHQVLLGEVDINRQLPIALLNFSHPHTGDFREFHAINLIDHGTQK